MSDWQPISTAPRDGTAFLAFDGEINVGFWDRAASSWSISGEFTFHPSHWMPLPQPPEDAR